MMVMIYRRKESGNFLQLLKQIESKERDYIVLVGQCPRRSVTQRITEAMALYCTYLVKVDDTSFVSRWGITIYFSPLSNTVAYSFMELGNQN